MSETLRTTSLEKESLEAHVDLCALRYDNLNNRLNTVESTLKSIHEDIKSGQNSMTKVLVGTAGTVIAGLLSTVVVVLMKF
jgi:chromosome segregation ATPase